MTVSAVGVPARKILLVSVDCLRADALFDAPGLIGRTAAPPGAAAAGAPDWPRLRALAGSATAFTRCVTTSPYTTAAHASAFTGCLPAQHGVRDYFSTPMQRPTLFQALRARGYTTRFVTDYPRILGRHIGFTRGIDDYRVEDQVAAFAEFWASPDPEVLFVHFADVHFPYGAHLIREHPELEPFVVAEARQLGLRLDTGPAPTPLEAERSPDEAQLEQHYRQILEARYRRGDYPTLLRWYCEGLAAFDRGRFAAFEGALQASGMLNRQDSLVLMFGDHGEDWSGSCWAHFNSCDWSVINVPLLAWGRGFEPGLRTDLVGLVDIAPTVLRAAGHPDALADAGPSTSGAALAGRDLRDGGRRGLLFAECWLSDGERLHQFMRAVQAGRTDVMLPRELAKDAAYDDVAELQRWFAAGLLEQEFLTRSGLPWGEGAAAVGERLAAGLEDYSRSAVRPRSVVDLRAALKQQGYFRRAR